MEKTSVHTLSLYERRSHLVRSQLQKIAKMATDGVVELPVTAETVLSHVDTNFSFYFGALTRRNHIENHGLAERLTYEDVQQQYMTSIAHIGYMINRGSGGEVIELRHDNNMSGEDIELLAA